MPSAARAATGLGPGGHGVRLYEDDADLVREVSRPVGAALGAGALAPDRFRERPAMADQPAVRLAHLIDQLLDMSRLEAGRLALELAAADLAALVTSVAAAAQARTERHTIADCTDEPVTVMVDPLRLEQVRRICPRLDKCHANGGRSLTDRSIRMDYCHALREGVGALAGIDREAVLADIRETRQQDSPGRPG